MITMLCSGICGGLCYYRAPYEHGAAFLLVQGVPPEVTAPVHAARVVIVLNEIISQFELDQRAMAEHFLRQQGFAVEASAERLVGRRSGREEIEVRFDAQGLITTVDTLIQPATPPPPWWKFWARR